MAEGKTMGKLREFSAKDSDWSIFRARLEQYFIANGITEETVKRALLLNACDEDAYRLIFSLCVPEKAENKNYKDLVQLFDKHFKTTTSAFAARHKFYGASKSRVETVAEWAARLRNLASKCEFGAELEVVLRDKFIMGLDNMKILERLFEEKVSISLDRAIELASIERKVTQEHNVKEEIFNHRDHVHSRGGRGFGNRGVAQPQRRPRQGPQDGSHSLPPKMTPQNEGTRRRFGGRTHASCSTGPVNVSCQVCGKHGHVKDKCIFKSYFCNFCNEKGHLAKMCSKKNRGNYFLDNNSEVTSAEELNFNLDNLFNLSSQNDEITIEIMVNKKLFTFQLDTGASVSVISEKFKNKYFSSFIIFETKKVLVSYDGSIISPLGFIEVEITFNSKMETLRLYVIEKGGPPLLGRDFFNLFNLSVNNINNLVYKKENSLAIEDLRDLREIKQILSRKFSKVFSPHLGKFTGGTLRLDLQEGAKPKFCKARSVPFALSRGVEAELDRLVMENILSPVSYSSWSTPIVPVAKKNGTIRICGDYKITLNPVLLIDKYPLPRIEELFSKLQGGVEFSKIDLSQAYQQIELDDESKKLTTINTHKGLFVYNRLPFGVASAPAMFQRIMEQVLAGLDGVVCFLDDILITGKNRGSHLQKVEIVLNRLQKSGFTVALNKCELFKDSVHYLGYTIDRYGLHTCKEKVRAIVEAPEPQNITQLRSFLGFVNFYNKFIPNAASVLRPLYNLLKKNVTFNWSEECTMAYKKIKDIVSSAPILEHYDPGLPVKLTVDSSYYGVGATIAHVIDNQEKPISFASLTLSSSQQKYSQVEKEALAIVFGVKKFYQYLYGRKFTIKTDAKCLVTLFGNKKGIPPLATNRLQRWALILSNFVYDIEYVQSKNNNADYFSRLPLKEELKEFDCESSYLNYIASNTDLPIVWEQIKNETQRDKILAQVCKYVNMGWPKKLSLVFKPYINYKNNFSVVDGCLMLGHKVVVPCTLQKNVLNQLHNAHFGMVKTKSLARSYVWWPRISYDIENLVTSCEYCLKSKSDPPKSPLKNWDYPERAWERIHIDFLGPIFDKYILVLVDAHTKWLEAVVTSNTKSSSTINILRDIFARFGLPFFLVSDNATTFKSNEFQTFLGKNGIKFLEISPFHPASNGQAENAVKTVKQALTKVIKKTSIDELNRSLNNFLLSYRIAPHCSTGKSPASLMFQRNIRSVLDFVNNNINVTKPSNSQGNLELNCNKIIKSQKNQCKYFKGIRNKNYSVGDHVAVRDYRIVNKPSWIKGVIHKKIGPKTYFVIIPSLNKTWRRHINQIIDFEFSVDAQSSEESLDNKITHHVTTDCKLSNENDCGSATLTVPDLGTPRRSKRKQKPIKYF